MLIPFVILVLSAILEKFCNMYKIRWQSTVKLGGYGVLMIVGMAILSLFPLYGSQLRSYGTVGLGILFMIELFTIICGDNKKKLNYLCGFNSLVVLGLWVYYAFFSQS